jgi:hypothetical protein
VSGPNTTGGQYPQSFTVPDRCSHGVGWAYPCAACGRPYQPAAEVHVTISDKALADIAAAIRELAAAIRGEGSVR